MKSNILPVEEYAVSERTSYVLGTPSWVDLQTSITATAAAFCATLFGWKADFVPDPAAGGYGMLSLRDRYVAGIEPNGMDTEIIDWDATTGGRWSYVARRDEEEFGFHGCFHEVGTDRIVQTFTFDGQPDDVSLETLRLEDLGDGRTRLHAQSLVDSLEGRDQWLASGMETGVNDGYAKLDVLVAGLQ